MALIRSAAEGRRPAILLDLAPESSGLAGRFDAAGAEGFAEAVAGDVELTGVARRGEDGVTYLPCGRRAEGRELAASRALVALADRVRAADGALLVVLARGSAAEAAAAGWPDGWVLVGDPDAASGAGGVPGDLPEYGRIEPRAGGDATDGRRWGRHRKTSSFPTLKVTGAAVLLLGLVAVWWWYAGRVAGGPGTAEGVVPVRPDSAAVAGSGTAELSGPPPTDSAGRGARVGTSEGAVQEYSVLVASYASAAVARERARRLTERPGGLFFVAPTRVRDTLWHRVYAGSVSERVAADTLMARLVEAGVKEEARAWDVRPVPWTLRIPAVFAERAEAEARAEELRSRGLPAYVLPVAGGDDFRVYSGAFESRGAAGALRDRLEREDVQTELVRRRAAGR